MYPHLPKLTVSVAKAAIVLIWGLVVVIMCPAALALTVEQIPFHYMVYNEDFNNTIPLNTCYKNFAKPQMRKIYIVVLFVCIYLVPLTAITFMYGSIVVKLYSSVVANREPQQANDTVWVGERRAGKPMKSQKKVVMMRTLVNVFFMASWLPLWTLMMMVDYADLDRHQLDLRTSYIFPFAQWLAFFNSSINPIIYGYCNENFKKGFQALCKSKPFSCLMQCQPWEQMSRWGRKERSAPALCRREATTNHNHLVLRIRNRVDNTDKLPDTAEVNRNARVGCVVVHSERSHPDQGLEMAIIQKKGKRGRKGPSSGSFSI